MTEARAHIVTEDGATAVLFRRGNYSERIPLSLLDARINFYRRFCGPKSPSAAFYRSSLEALEQARSELEARDV